MRLRQLILDLAPRLSADAWLRTALAALLVLVPVIAFPANFWAEFPGSLEHYSPFSSAGAEQQHVLTRWFLQSRGWVALAAIVFATIGVTTTTKRGNESAFYATVCTFYVGVLWPLVAATFGQAADEFIVAHGEPAWLLPMLAAFICLIVVALSSRRAIGLAPSSGLAGAAVFFEHRPAVMLALGFAAGLPNLLIYDTLSVWMRQAKVPLDVITLMSLVTITYAIKFLWAPLVDRLKLPLLHQLFGKRRAWMLFAQAGVVLGIWLIAMNAPGVSAAVASGADPGAQPDPNMNVIAMVAVCAAVAAVFGATQDIAIDAWRIEVATVERQGAMAAAYQWGYRISIIVSGAVPLWLASRIGWTSSYSLMALVMGVGVMGVLLAPRERSVDRPPDMMRAGSPLIEAAEWIGRLALMIAGAAFIGAGLAGRAEPLTFLFSMAGFTEFSASVGEIWGSRPWGMIWQGVSAILGLLIVGFATYPFPGAKTRPSAYFAATLKEPLDDFFKRYRGTGALILAMICVYRIADFVLNLMGVFYVDVGFTLDEIANARKLFGVLMSVLGVGLGGWMVVQFGLMRSLLVGAILQPLSNVFFGLLAFTGPWLPGLYLCIGVDNISAGVAGTALIAYMSSLTSLGFTATQYALFSSLYALPGKFLAAISGRIVEGAIAAAAAGETEWLRSWFNGMSPTAFAALSADRGIPAQAFAAGYMTFFIYSGLVGIFALVLALAIMRKSPPPEKKKEEEIPAPA